MEFSIAWQFIFIFLTPILVDTYILQELFLSNGTLYHGSDCIIAYTSRNALDRKLFDEK